jgi:hypothetical protein
LAAGSWARRNLAAANEQRPKSPSMGSIHFHRPTPSGEGRSVSVTPPYEVQIVRRRPLPGWHCVGTQERASLRAAPARCSMPRLPPMRDTTRQDPSQTPERHCRLSVARGVVTSSRSPNVTCFCRPCVSFFFFFGAPRAFQPTCQLRSLLCLSRAFRCVAAADLSNAVSWRLGSLDPSARNHHAYARLEASKRSIESACDQSTALPHQSPRPAR